MENFCANLLTVEVMTYFTIKNDWSLGDDHPAQYWDINQSSQEITLASHVFDITRNLNQMLRVKSICVDCS